MYSSLEPDQNTFMQRPITSPDPRHVNGQQDSSSMEIVRSSNRQSSLRSKYENQTIRTGISRMANFP